MTVSLDFDLTGVAIPVSSTGEVGQEPFRAEIRYFNGSIYITDEVTFTSDGGRYSAVISGRDSGSLTSVSFRLTSMIGAVIAQQVSVSGDTEFHSATPEELRSLGGNDGYANWLTSKLGVVSDHLPSWLAPLIGMQNGNGVEGPRT